MAPCHALLLLANDCVKGCCVDAVGSCQWQDSEEVAREIDLRSTVIEWLQSRS